jgi:hypothetical protein
VSAEIVIRTLKVGLGSLERGDCLTNFWMTFAAGNRTTLAFTDDP